MDFFIVILALAVLGVGIYLYLNRGLDNPKLLAAGALSEPEPDHAPVILAEEPSGSDVDDIRLSLALRGYRTEEVDDVLDTLAAQLSDLREQLAKHERGPRT